MAKSLPCAVKDQFADKEGCCFSASKVFLVDKKQNW